MARNKLSLEENYIWEELSYSEQQKLGISDPVATQRRREEELCAQIQKFSIEGKDKDGKRKQKTYVDREHQPGVYQNYVGEREPENGLGRSVGQYGSPDNGNHRSGTPQSNRRSRHSPMRSKTDHRQDRRDESIKRKLKLIETKVEYDGSKGDSFRIFYQNFLFLYNDYLNLGNEDLKFKFSESFKEESVRFQILSLIHQYPNLSFKELAAKASVIVSSESRQQHISKFKSMERGDNESLVSFCTRLKNSYHDVIPSSQFFQVVGTELYENALLEQFYIGLRSSELRENILKQEPLTLDSACSLGNEFLKNLAYLELSKKIGSAFSGSPDIPISRDLRILRGKQCDENIDKREAKILRESAVYPELSQEEEEKQILFDRTICEECNENGHVSEDCPYASANDKKLDDMSSKDEKLNEYQRIQDECNNILKSRKKPRQKRH